MRTPLVDLVYKSKIVLNYQSGRVLGKQVFSCGLWILDPSYQKLFELTENAC